MSLIRIIVTDRNTALSGDLHGSDADRLIASLTAEPETHKELEHGFTRFAPGDFTVPVFQFFSSLELSGKTDFSNIDFSPFDAGILVIDLAGRTIGCESTYSLPSKEGTIRVADRLSDDPFKDSFRLPYELPDDWEIVRYIDEFRHVAATRRNKRLAKPVFDERGILFGRPLLRFLASEMGKSEIPENGKLQAHLHGVWLLTERDDLGGRTPREVLLEKRHFIEMDLQMRSLQWSFTKDPPPELSVNSYAYLHGGFGTHENVVYYDLIRYLLEAFHERILARGRCGIEEGIHYLEGKRDKWLAAPNAEYSGRIPSEIIEFERRRRNMTMSPHESIIDEDCPICVEMSQIFDTPMFWHLDGSHMDREFAFSFYKTYEEWQKEELAFESFMKKQTERLDTDDYEDADAFIREMKF